ncbi:MAG: nucleotidyltransferase family protein [Anaerolineae bacterium]|jgi:hypothetical protein|nr:nucleotidyltransferase family protein [Anaerolineae bacterium]MBT7988460.1 nucleotidyltransferase family protein [Anaerolineae bacterium]
MKELPKLYDLLTLCARAQANPAHYDRLREAAEKLPSWDNLPHLAELHSIAPLVYTHLQAAKIDIPKSAENDLKAHYLRHNHANRIRTRALAEVLKAFQDADIQVLVLKGMAVAHLVYPHPRLRPMSDIDLLVSKGNAQEAQAQLKKLGFSMQAPGKNDFEHHHLPPASRQINGIPIHIEIHHNLSRKQSPTTNFEALYPRAIPFNLSGVPAHALGYADMLAHTYNHLVEAPFQSFRLIWIADMVSLIEKFADQVDWERVPPRVSNLLPLLSEMPPFNLTLLENAHHPKHLRGYPFNVLPAQNKKEYLNNIPKAFNPSLWWLRLHYGIFPDYLLLAVRVWHTLHLLWWGIRFRGLPQITRRFKEYIRGTLHLRK